MRSALLLRAALLASVAAILTTSVSRAQTISTTISTTTSVSIKTFTPIDSVFINPTATSFSIALANSVSGSPTEYRVSRFSDFRDANWLAYSSRPNIAVPRTWFPTSTSGTQQITLYLQVRAKNPKAGQPISVIDGVTKVQPDYFFSDPVGRRIRLIYAG